MIGILGARFFDCGSHLVTAHFWHGLVGDDEVEGQSNG
jgi:hypothetical protein